MSIVGCSKRLETHLHVQYKIEHISLGLCNYWVKHIVWEFYDQNDTALCFSSLVFLKAKMLLESMQSAEADCTLSWLDKFLQHSCQLPNFIPIKIVNYLKSAPNWALKLTLALTERNSHYYIKKTHQWIHATNYISVMWFFHPLKLKRISPINQFDRYGNLIELQRRIETNGVFVFKPHFKNWNPKA